MTSRPGGPHSPHSSQVASTDPHTSAIEHEILGPSLELSPLALEAISTYDIHDPIHPQNASQAPAMHPISHLSLTEPFPTSVSPSESLDSDAPSPFIPPRPLSAVISLPDNPDSSSASSFPSPSEHSADAIASTSMIPSLHNSPAISAPAASWAPTLSEIPSSYPQDEGYPPPVPQQYRPLPSSPISLPHSPYSSSARAASPSASEYSTDTSSTIRAALRLVSDVSPVVDANGYVPAGFWHPQDGMPPSAQASASPFLTSYEDPPSRSLSGSYYPWTSRTRPEHASSLFPGVDPMLYSDPVYPSHLYSSPLVATSRPWGSAPPAAFQPLPSNDHVVNIPPPPPPASPPPASPPPASPPPAASAQPAAPNHSNVQDESAFTIPIYTRNHRLFGFARQRQQQDKSSTTGPNPFHYENKYPPDAVYEETGPHARLWRTYLDESQMHDFEMVEYSRDSVDVLLVFAGLFSAVVTAFVAQTSQALQMPSDTILTSLVYELVNIQRASHNGTSVDDVPFSALTPASTEPQSSSIVWVNGLWFVSLSLSLTTALLSVLVKQWFHQYVSMPSGTPRDRSLIRQYRFSGLQKWHVPMIVGLLPVLMHGAVAVFFCGLIVYLLPLNLRIAIFIIAIFSGAYTVYIVSQALPIVYPQCPYKTPISTLISSTIYRLVHWSSSSEPLKEQELRIVNSPFSGVAVDAIRWLYDASSNFTVRSIVIQALGGLSLSQSMQFHELLVKGEMMDIGYDQDLLIADVVEAVFDATTNTTTRLVKSDPGAGEKFQRIVRSILVRDDAWSWGQRSPLFGNYFVWPLNNDDIPQTSTSQALQAAMGRIADKEADLHSARSFFLQKHTRLHLSVWSALMFKVESTKEKRMLYYTPLDPSSEQFDPIWFEHLVSIK